MAVFRHTHVTNAVYGATMDQMNRFAVYYAPRPGEFATVTAALLGWDNTQGRSVPLSNLTGLPAPLADLTTDPRKYGFHGTIRAPFRPALGCTTDDVADAVRAVSCQFPPAVCTGLQLVNLHGFLALVPMGDTSALNNLAAEVVRATNHLRAPLTPAEIARRRPDSLTPEERDLLDRWGYPFVMGAFQFHLTLTNRLSDSQVAQVAPILSSYLGPSLPEPFVVEDLCLFGEDGKGRFHLLHRFALSG